MEQFNEAERRIKNLTTNEFKEERRVVDELYSAETLKLTDKQGLTKEQRRAQKSLRHKFEKNLS